MNKHWIIFFTGILSAATVLAAPPPGVLDWRLYQMKCMLNQAIDIGDADLTADYVSLEDVRFDSQVSLLPELAQLEVVLGPVCSKDLQGKLTCAGASAFSVRPVTGALYDRGRFVMGGDFLHHAVEENYFNAPIFGGWRHSSAMKLSQDSPYYGVSMLTLGRLLLAVSFVVRRGDDVSVVCMRSARLSSVRRGE